MTAVIKEKIIEIQATEAPKSESKVDALGRAYASGRRKNATARAWIKKGTGKIKVNNRDGKTYFGREILVNVVKAPFVAAKSHAALEARRDNKILTFAVSLTFTSFLETVFLTFNNTWITSQEPASTKNFVIVRIKSD